MLGRPKNVARWESHGGTQRGKVLGEEAGSLGILRDVFLLLSARALGVGGFPPAPLPLYHPSTYPFGWRTCGRPWSFWEFGDFCPARDEVFRYC